MAKTNRKITNSDITIVFVYDHEERKIDARGHNVAFKSSISMDKELYKTMKLIVDDVDKWVQEQYLLIKRNKLAKRSGYSRAIQRSAIKLLASHINKK